MAEDRTPEQQAGHDKWVAEQKAKDANPVEKSPADKVDAMSDDDVLSAMKDHDNRVAEVQEDALQLGLTFSGMPRDGDSLDGHTLAQPGPYLIRGGRDSGLTVEQEAANRVERIRRGRILLGKLATEKADRQAANKARHAADKARVEAEKSRKDAAKDGGQK